MHRVIGVYRRLLAHYGPQGWWPGESRFVVIVGALLMHQTSWRNVATAIGNLRRAHLLDMRRIAGAGIRPIERHVRVAGLHRSKPARLRAFCRHLIDRADGDLDRYFGRPTGEVRRDLLRQSGVGPETADSILLYAGGHPVFVVDAYTVRIARRLGWLRTDRYDDVQRFFVRNLPMDPSMYGEYHALLVAHAKAFCQPKPRCGPCPLRRVCAFGRDAKRISPSGR